MGSEGVAYRMAGEQKLRSILEALPVAIYETDADGTVTFFNEAAAQMAGRRPRIGVDKWCVSWQLKTIDGDPLPLDECPMAVTLKERRAVKGEAIAVRPDGTEIRFAANPTPLFDDDGNLIGAVNMLIDTTHRHRTGIEAARLAAIVASSDDAIVSKDLNGIVITWNGAAERLFGYLSEEIVGRHISLLIPPDRQDEEPAILRRIRRGERVEHFDTIRRRKDGALIEISLTISPVLDETGRIIGASKIARDISERKRAEDMQRMLIGELNHRVKNTLATVQAIAQQTLGRSKSPSDFAHSFTGRLQSLARAHTLLTQTAWRGADLKQLIHDQLLLSGTEEERITLVGPWVTLEPQAALHLSLIMHELGTNARKYGSLSTPQGRLNVVWSVEMNGGRELVLKWEERGGPPVRMPTAKGFGTTLIEHSLQGHGGDVALRYEADGLTCVLRLPLPQDTASRGAYMQISQAHAMSEHAKTLDTILRGKRVLVVDDEPIVAMDIEAALLDHGIDVAGPAGSIESAQALIDAGGFQAALLDVNLGGRKVDELAAALTRLDIPFAFLTGYERKDLPQAFRQAPMLAKPFSRAEVIDALGELLKDREGVTRLKQKG
jgi:PAS domain S-box-containing protein